MARLGSGVVPSRARRRMLVPMRPRSRFSKTLFPNAENPGPHPRRLHASPLRIDLGRASFARLVTRAQHPRERSQEMPEAIPLARPNHRCGATLHCNVVTPDSKRCALKPEESGAPGCRVANPTKAPDLLLSRPTCMVRRLLTRPSPAFDAPARCPFSIA